MLIKLPLFIILWRSYSYTRPMRPVLPESLHFNGYPDERMEL